MVDRESVAPAAPASTHDLDIGVDAVTKRFRSWSRDEPSREWSALALLSEYAPGLAPEPVSAQLTAAPPVIVMSRVPGESLGAVPVDGPQLDALAIAIERLHAAVPSEVVARLPLRIWHPRETLAEIRAWAAGRPELGPDPTVRTAYREAVRWLDRPALDAAVLPEHETVLGRADGNIANHVWDGSVVRLVDFEDSGRSDPVFEVADLVEHIATQDAGIEAVDLVDRLMLNGSEPRRLRTHRRLFASFWFLMLLPGGPASSRNPPATLQRQADRLLQLLA